MIVNQSSKKNLATDIEMANFPNGIIDYEYIALRHFRPRDDLALDKLLESNETTSFVSATDAKYC